MCNVWSACIKQPYISTPQASIRFLQGAIRVLVTGAAGGSQGATGRLLIHLLLKWGVHVRVFVRSSHDHAASLNVGVAEVQREATILYVDTLLELQMGCIRTLSVLPCMLIVYPPQLLV